MGSGMRELASVQSAEMAEDAIDVHGSANINRDVAVVKINVSM